jgi:hypothetical protein
MVRYFVIGPENTYFCIGRKIGKLYKDEVKGINPRFGIFHSYSLFL